MATYVLSYPSPTFSPDGQQAPSPAAAQRAFRQWLELADQITRATGRIMIVDPPAQGPNDLVYASRLGAPFLRRASGEQPLFLRAKNTDAPLSASEDPVCRTLTEAGLSVAVSQHRWQGQAEIIALPHNRFLLTYGPHTDPASCDEIRKLLPMGAHVLCIEMAAETGLAGLNLISARNGNNLLLVDRAALRSHTPEDIGRFSPRDTELSILGSEDIAARATESLCVRGTVLMSPGTTTQLRGHLVRRGFQAVEVDVSALFGPSGGGPRALCNEWLGFVLSDEAPSYANRRGELFAHLEHYGEG